MSPFQKSHRDLLGAARREVVPAEVRARLLAPMGPAPSPGAAPRGGAVRLVAGAAAVVALALLVVRGVAPHPAPATEHGSTPVVAIGNSEVPSEPPSLAGTTPPEAPSPAGPIPSPDEQGSLRSAPSTTAAATARRAPTPAPHAGVLPAIATSAAPSAAPPDEGGLGAEAAILGGAKRALSSGDLPAASAALAAYFRRFPAGALREEAEALSIERAIRAGEHAHAVGALSAFEHAHPRSATAARLRHMLPGTANSPNETQKRAPDEGPTITPGPARR